MRSGRRSQTPTAERKAKKREEKMIVDLILDRKDNTEFDGIDSYNAHDFYMECMEYNGIFEGIADGITKAMDYGTEAEVKRELCKYIICNGYNKTICDYINSVKWIE